MRVTLLLLLAAAPVLLVSSSCGAPVEADDGDDDDDDDDDDPPPLEDCVEQADCGTFELCIDGFCRQGCGEAEPCLGDRRICDLATGACVQCLEDVHCADGEVCNSIGDCQLAEPETTCTPNEVGCVDDATAFVCTADGSERVEAACRDNQFCEAGVCRTRVCEPDSVVCAGNALLVCDATGTDSTVSSCDDVCDDGGFGCACVDADAGATCEARVCTAGEARCVGNASQRCDPDGMAFGDLEDCGADSCIAGACLPDECVAGTTSCAGPLLLTCDDDGAGYVETECAEACIEDGDGAACGDQVCTPLEQVCLDADTLSVCNATGTAAVTAPCGANRACEDGACVDETCEPQCGARECGPDPVCGASCGSCAGTCSSDGVCTAGAGPLLSVELSWTPTSQDMDLYLTRDADGTMCISDACSLHTCTTGDVERPDWNGDGVAGDGNPLLVDGPTENPERIELRLGAAAITLRAGADNVGPTSSGGSAAATSATVRVRLDGTVVATLTKSVPVGALWKGVSLAWDGSDLTSTDLGTVPESFDCTAPTGNACTTDSDCPAGQGCVTDTLIFGTCSNAVECVRDADCSNSFLVCNGNHACVLPLLLADWQEDCRNGDGNTDTANCHVGFHCDFFTQVCEEACNPQGAAAGTSVSCAGVDNCCEASGGDTCTADLLFGLTGNCG